MAFAPGSDVQRAAVLSGEHAEDWADSLRRGRASVCVINVLAFVDIYFIFLTGIVFLKAFHSIFCSVPFAGVKFLEDCPVHPLVPVYLLLVGIIGALKVMSVYQLFVVLVEI